MSVLEQGIRDRIPFLNFIMMCCIIFYHCEMPISSPLPINDMDRFCNLALERTAAIFATLGMSVFFTTSGFLLFFGLDKASYTRKMKSRIQTLLIPYLLWQLVYTLKAFIQGSIADYKTLFAQIFLFRFWPPLGAFWYIYALFILALASPLLLLLFRNKKIAGISVLVLILLSHYTELRWNWIPRHDDLGYLRNVISYFPSYLIGAFYGHYYQEKTGDSDLFYAISLILAGMLFDGCLTGFMEKTVIQTVPIFLLFFFPVKEWMKERRLYKISFLMYATHQSCISLFCTQIRNIVGKYTNYVWQANIAGRIITIIIIILVNALFYQLLKKMSPRFLKSLTGGRSE